MTVLGWGLDLPFSFVADSILLPYDVVHSHLQLRAWHAREVEMEVRRRDREERRKR